MSTFPWWWRNLTSATSGVLAKVRIKPAPKAPKPSPMGRARADGWMMEAAGVWAHPALGTVERETAGTWKATAPDGCTADPSDTMTEAMHTLAAYANAKARAAADAAAAQDGERGAA